MSTPAFRYGSFIWRELMTNDLAASLRFYTEAFGWKANTMSMGDQPYTMFMVDQAPVAGMVQMPGQPPFWAGSISVENVDTTTHAVTAAGGKVLAGPMDIPNMGRYCMCLDPQGAAFSIWHAAQGDGDAMPPTPGYFCWEHLNASSVDDAVAFYTKTIGWQRSHFAPTGTTNFGVNGCDVASVMPTQPGMPAAWMSYVTVEDLAAARGRVERLGGAALSPEHEIPTVGTICVMRDNVGAVIGLMQPTAQH